MNDERVTIGRPTSAADWDAYYELRWRVLRAPWEQPRGSERDPTDASAYHLCAKYSDGRLLGCGRLHLNAPEEAQIRYMAVDPAAERRGVGRLLLTGLEAEAARLGCRIVTLNSRSSAQTFYERHGYSVNGPAPTLFGVIPHVRMSKELVSVRLGSH